MKRNIDLNEITDGRFYQLDDMVRADCRDCVGCSKCCHEMVDTILLDPLDCFRLSMALSCSFDELITGEKIELELIDGIILPHLKFQQNTGCCPFLNSLGRCDIHAFRPGFCRMFPLGRYYSKRTFCYILQTKECPKPRTKTKVSKWINTVLLPQNQKFINDWHYFLEDLANQLSSCPPETVRQAQLYLLHTFYRTGYSVSDKIPETAEAAFYQEFYKRFEKAQALLV